MVLLVGLTGGIAAGKSTVARRFAAHGAHVVDADQLARDVVEPSQPAYDAIVETFGPGILSADGSLDRAALGRRIFGDPQQRRRLEQITHPAIQALFRERVAAVSRERPDAVVVYDVPLLAEGGGGRRAFDLVVVAHAPRAVRAERLQAERGMSADEAWRRIDAQASDAERLALADEIVDTGGSLAQTEAETDRVWRRIESLRR